MHAVLKGCAAVFLISTGLVSAGNLIQNPGFETGTFSGWTVSGAGTLGSDYGISTNIPHSGTYSAWFGTPSGITYISQTFTTVPGEFYDVSFWVANQHQGPNPVNEFIVMWGSATPLDLVNSGNANWQHAGGMIAASGTTTTLEFGFMNVPGWFALDDVSVTQAVPEPGAILLAGGGLGCLLLLRIRRGRADLN